MSPLLPWRRRPERRDLAELCPVPLVESQRREDGTLDLLLPRFRDPVLGRLLQPRLPHPHIRLHLDEIGTETWELLDGRRTVREIAAVLAERRGEDFDPGSRRLALFLLNLERNGLIRYRLPGEGEA